MRLFTIKVPEAKLPKQGLSGYRSELLTRDEARRIAATSPQSSGWPRRSSSEGRNSRNNGLPNYETQPCREAGRSSPERLVS
jgi:hypothetical protein